MHNGKLNEEKTQNLGSKPIISSACAWRPSLEEASPGATIAQCKIVAA
jgi:hypothetical protein